MDADDKRERPENNDAMQISGLLRAFFTLSHESIKVAVAAKGALNQSVTAAATQGDDPWLMFLEKEYLSKLCFLSDIAVRHKLYRVAKKMNWPSTSETTVRALGRWSQCISIQWEHAPFVADVVLGPRGIRLTKSGRLLGYILAQYIDGDDEDPIRTECVDLANAKHNNSNPNPTRTRHP
jgi:hypothetical protein